jgi:tripartite-type tricarboxylate transporter receptor subunit TctC
MSSLSLSALRARPSRHAQAALLAITLSLVSGVGLAQGSWPTRPVRVVVPTAAGGTVDIITRTLVSPLAQALAQPVIVENRAAASTSVGEEAVARATPDGYTLLMSGLTLSTTPLLRSDLPYDPQADLAPIVLVATAANVLVVNPSLPVSSVAELIAYAKGRADPLYYGTPSFGATGHFAAEMFNQMAGTKFQHVPYKGSALALQDLMAGQIQMTFDNIPAAIGHIQSGRLRALGVTSSTRSAQLPGVPTIAEAGLPGYVMTGWFGLLAPAHTPVEIINRVQAETARALARPEVRERFASLGFDPVGSTPEAFRKLIADEAVRMGRIVRAAGMRQP